MPNQACRVAFCLVIAFAMTFELLRPFGYLISHDPTAFVAARSSPLLDRGNR